jgi:hypothetical protein
MDSHCLKPTLYGKLLVVTLVGLVEPFLIIVSSDVEADNVTHTTKRYKEIY